MFRDTTPVVEGISIDEAFLDVGGCGGSSGTPRRSPRSSARDVRAGRAADHGRGGEDEVPGEGGQRGGQADGLLVVEPAGELKFLHALPVERLWGVGAVTAGKLHAHRVMHRRAGGPARRGHPRLDAGRGLRAAPARPGAQPGPAARASRAAAPVDGAQRALGRGPHQPRVRGGPGRLVDRVCRRLRAAERGGRTVVLRLRFADFTKVTRSHTLAKETWHTATVLERYTGCTGESRRPHRRPCGLTLIGIAVAQSRRGRRRTTRTAAAGAHRRRARHSDGSGPEPVRLGGTHPGVTAGPAAGARQLPCCRIKGNASTAQCAKLVSRYQRALCFGVRSWVS